MTFTHLHDHSHYSLLRGVDSIESLAQAARDQGMDRFSTSSIASWPRICLRTIP